MSNTKHETEKHDPEKYAAWLIPQIVHPKEGQYLVVEYVEFIDGKPKYFFSLHSPNDSVK